MQFLDSDEETTVFSTCCEFGGRYVTWLRNSKTAPEDWTEGWGMHTTQIPKGEGAVISVVYMKINNCPICGEKLPQDRPTPGVGDA
jgi:hypothetical protein